MGFNASAFAQAAAAPGFDEPPPPALYEALFRDFDIFESKAGKLTLRLSWTVLTGQLRDHEWSHVQTLEQYNDQGEDNPALAITARVVEAIGVDVQRVSAYEGAQALTELRRQLGEHTGGAYEVEVKRNGQYVNTTPKQRLRSVQETMPTSASSYGQQQTPKPPPGPRPEASRQGDGLNLSTDDVRRDVERTGESDVPSDASGFERPPQRGDVDPETGEPIPFLWEPPSLEWRRVERNPFA